jgi:hypothetical protein
MFRRAVKGKTVSRVTRAQVEANTLTEQEYERRRVDVVNHATSSQRWGYDVWHGGAEYPPGLKGTGMAWCKGCRRFVPPQAVRQLLRRFAVVAPTHDAAGTLLSIDVLAGVYGSCRADAIAEAMAQLGRADVDVLPVVGDGFCDTCALNHLCAVDEVAAILLPPSLSVITVYDLHPADRKEVRAKEAEREADEAFDVEEQAWRRRERALAKSAAGDARGDDPKSGRRRFKANPGHRSPMAEAWAEMKRQERSAVVEM